MAGGGHTNAADPGNAAGGGEPEAKAPPAMRRAPRRCVDFVPAVIACPHCGQVDTVAAGGTRRPRDQRGAVKIQGKAFAYGAKLQSRKCLACRKRFVARMPVEAFEVPRGQRKQTQRSK